MNLFQGFLKRAMRAWRPQSKMNSPRSSAANKLSNTVANADIVLRRKVLAGCFNCLSSAAAWKCPHFKLLIFFSSTFTDTQVERNYLMDELLFELRAMAIQYDVPVIFVDMRWGVRDENSCDHKTWIECSRGIQWCKNESFGIFFVSLQADKYGYTPLPKYIPSEGYNTCVSAHPDITALIQKWYSLDENALPARYVLRNLQTHNDAEYWNDFKPILAALDGMQFDQEHYDDLVVGRSVTEWEVRSALQDERNHGGRPREALTSVMWSHRHFSCPVNASDDERRNFDDVRGDDARVSHLVSMKTWMTQQFPAATVEAYANHAIDLPGLKTLGGVEASEGGGDSPAFKYLQEFKKTMRLCLTASLQAVIAGKQSWERDGCGMGIPGTSLAEMLHHSQWAHTKCSTFHGRAALVEQAVSLIVKTPHRDAKFEDKFSGICLSMVGLSGSGKTALMAMIASKVSKQQEIQTANPLVIIRFCGTSGGSRNARSIVESICDQLALLLNLERKAIFPKYDDLIKHFHELLSKHVVYLFIDSLDQLTDEDKGRSHLSFLKGMKPHKDTRIVVSCLPDEFTLDPLSKAKIWKYCYQCETRLVASNVPRLETHMSPYQSSEVSTQLLAQRLRRLSATQWRFFERQKNVEPTALYIDLAVRVVQHWTSQLQEGSDMRLEGGVQPLIQQIFESLERDYGKALVRAALGYITFAVAGVSDVEMEDLLSLNDDVLKQVFQYAIPKIERIPSHVWLRLRGSLYGMVMEGEGGCLTWYHRQLKETAAAHLQEERIGLQLIMARYFGNMLDPSLLRHRMIIAHDWTVCGRSPFEESSTVNKRRCVEAGHHMVAAISKLSSECVMNELCSFAGICSKIRAGEAHSLVNDLANLRLTMDNSELEAILHKVNSFLRWLKHDLHFLSHNPIRRFLASATNQPKTSMARVEAMNYMNAPLESTSYLPSSVVRTRSLGGASDFDGMVAKLGDHSDYVTSVQYSPDGSQIASASWDKTVRLWDVLTCVNTAILEGHTSYVTCVCFSPNGKLIASCSHDMTVRLWDSSTHANILVLVLTDVATSVSFSHCGHTVAAACLATIQIWDAISGNPTKSLKWSDAAVTITGLSFNVPDSRIAASFIDHIVRVWDLSSGVLMTLVGHTASVRSVFYSSDGNYLLSTSKDKTSRVWNALTSALVLSLTGHTDAVTAGCFSADCTHIATASQDKTVRVWNVTDGSCLSVIHDHTNFVSSVCFNREGSQFVTGCDDKQIRVFDLAASLRPCCLEGHTEHVNCAAISPDGQHVASGSHDFTVKLWNVLSGANVSTWKGHSGLVKAVSFSPDSKMVLSSSWDKTARVWEVATSKLACTLNGHSRFVATGSFSPVDSNSVATGSGDGSVKLWNVSTKTCVSSLSAHSEPVYCVCYSADGSKVAAASWDNSISLWEVISGTKLAMLTGHTDGVMHVAFNPANNNLLVSASKDKTVKVWDVLTTQNVSTIAAHSDFVNTVMFSADGQRILSASDDHTVRQWDTATGAKISELQGHTDRVSSAVYNSNSNHIVSCSLDKTIRIWNI